MLSIRGLRAGILQDISLTLARGECLALVGPSGSGKTTLLNAVAGHIPYEGSIFLARRPLDDLPPWQRHCRHLNQRLYLFPHGTVAGNLRLAKGDSSREEQLALLAKLKIAPLIDRYPRQLSGGEQQRAALARALIQPPDLLLLDEPFSSLDWQTREHIWQTLKGLIQEFHITTLLVTHEPREADFFARRQIRLEAGQLMEEQR